MRVVRYRKQSTKRLEELIVNIYTYNFSGIAAIAFRTAVFPGSPCSPFHAEVASDIYNRDNLVSRLRCLLSIGPLCASVLLIDKHLPRSGRLKSSRRIDRATRNRTDPILSSRILVEHRINCRIVANATHSLSKNIVSLRIREASANDRAARRRREITRGFPRTYEIRGHDKHARVSHFFVPYVGVFGLVNIYGETYVAILCALTIRTRSILCARTLKTRFSFTLDELSHLF